MRLGDSYYVNSEIFGRVEVYLDGVWGTVHFDTGDYSDGAGEAVCRQLGFTYMGQTGTIITLR